MNRIFWHTTRSEVSPDDIPQWAIKLTAIIAVVIVTLFCVAARKLGTRVAVVFTTIKVGFIHSQKLPLICEGSLGSGFGLFQFFLIRVFSYSLTDLHHRPRYRSISTGETVELFEGTIIRGLKYKSSFLFFGILFRALGFRWMGPSELRGRGDTKPREKYSPGDSLEHVHCDGRPAFL
jgi:hypothetical protein